MSTPVAKLGQLLEPAPGVHHHGPADPPCRLPVGSIIGEVIASAMLTLYNDFYVIGVFAVCALMPIFILTGSHWIFMPTALSDLETMGFDPFLWVGFAVINFSQLAVALAIFFKAKNRDIKSFCRLRRPAHRDRRNHRTVHVRFDAQAEAPLGRHLHRLRRGRHLLRLRPCKGQRAGHGLLLSLPQFIDPTGSNNFVMAIIGMAITFAVTFAATWIFGFDEKDFEEE